ncbi:hypothetical protein N7532_006571 [Penicillium argentinense]|uniref:BRCT domain-containing protein n=1 Tax=Penicillium argentinense TaxID=1131581 RepID=A0A9W9KAZ4_9EURO|nr:uncharacterized protein N7532_006571 [Penicillium argentinense]KAJ5099570.1 hypothetical protein N7532_006571 [Penicillium argentinense]
METQDSLDIAKLQRVALGLEHEPSQSFPTDQAGIDSASLKDSLCLYDLPASRSYGDASPTYQGFSSIPPSNRAKSDLSHRSSHPSAATHHEKASMSYHNPATASSEVQPLQRSPPEQMESAECDPGDTQVVSQSVYDSIIRQNGESMYQECTQNGADGATLMTLHEGDSGHLDLLAEFDSARERNQSPNNDDESVYGQSPSSPIADHGLQPEFFPESQRFLTATPATAIKKNQTPGTSQTPSVSRNPLQGDVGSSGGLLMGLSQAFKNTQAPSSPLVHGLQSELASDRPSPNIPIQQRIHNPISSPLMNFPGHLAHESSEPNLNYISLKESQNNRNKTLGRRLTRSEENLHSGDQIDQEFYKEPSFVEAARRRREIDEETAAQFLALNSPERPESNACELSPAHSIHIHEDEAIGMEGAGREDGMEAAGSEEETEQEEDHAPQVPQSQESGPNSSMEEDKENYVGPHDAVVATNSAHDRLSQALGIDGSQLRLDHDANTAPQEPSAFDDSRPDEFVARSSQVMVKDSQQSPQASPQHGNAILGPQPVFAPMQIDSHIHVAQTSPVRQDQLSPLGSRPGMRDSQHPQENLQHQQIPQSSDHVDPRNMNGHSTSQSRTVDSSNSFSRPQPAGSLHRRTESGQGEKSSSLPSQIKETPIHLRQSPERVGSSRWEGESNADATNEDDDDLPPMFPAGHGPRFSQQQRPSQTRAQSSPIKAKPPILSSPSGRQRRRLTDIASDTSPQVNAKMGDIDMSFFANDPDFNALIQGSPTRPRKRRCGNLGQTFHTIPDTAIPSTPRTQPPKTIEPIREVSSPAQAYANHSSPGIRVPITTSRRQSGLSRRTDESVWEIENSPQQVIRRRSRSARQPACSGRRLRTPQPIPEQPQDEQPRDEQPDPPAAVNEAPETADVEEAPVKVPASEPTAPPAPTPSEPPPSSELMEMENGSEDLLPSGNLPASTPTSPQLPVAVYDDRQIAPSQILALWMGQKRAYYPGTCFGTPLGCSATKYSVKFEDSPPVEVNRGAVKRLELRIGDGVKVDMPGVPKVTHIVRGFEDKLTRDELGDAADRGVYPQTDVFGYSTLILGPKQRKSLPNGGLNNSDNIIRVPVGRIYFDMILWNQLKDRAFTYQPEPASVRESVPQTPSQKSSLPASPSARFSRSFQGVGLFSNMAFAVSYKEDDGSKNRVTTLIKENGGSILENGFTELFESSSVLPISTPTKGQSKERRIRPGLHLTDLAENVGFACLIADTHSRREKYMQALALNLPCLSGRWIEDCVAKGRVLNWDIYLLPAGDSMYLNGATKSRVMTPTPPSEARLVRTISTRPRLLAGNSVLIVMGRGKAEEKRKAYVFLTFALGASRVERVPDLETARAMMDSQFESGLPCTWDFIYVDDADQDAAREMLAPRPKMQRIHLVHGKKRKKSATWTLDNSDTNTTARVVGNEFVCQSLILGRLFEE